MDALYDALLSQPGVRIAPPTISWLVVPNGAGNVESYGNIMRRVFYPLQDTRAIPIAALMEELTGLRDA